MLTLLIISTIMFVAYTATVISMYGIPVSYSVNYYLFEQEKRGAGYIFTASMWAMVFTLLPPLMNVNSNDNFDFMKFLFAAMLAFTAAAPKYKTTDAVYHNIFAVSSAVMSILWAIVATDLWFVPLATYGASMLAMTLTNSEKSTHIFWSELALFASVFSIIHIYTYRNIIESGQSYAPMAWFLIILLVLGVSVPLIVKFWKYIIKLIHK